MGYTIAYILGLCVIPAIIAAVVWFTNEERKHRKAITVIVFLICLIVAYLIKGGWSDISTGWKAGVERAESEQEISEPSEATTEPNASYAKIGDLRVDITYLSYSRVKAYDELNLPDYTEEEKKEVWAYATNKTDAKVKAWLDSNGYYLFTLSKYGDDFSSSYKDLDDFIKDFNATNEDTVSGDHVDIDGVHAYKLLEKVGDSKDSGWDLAETIILLNGSIYVISVHPLYEGLSIDVDAETDRIISYTEII